MKTRCDAPIHEGVECGCQPHTGCDKPVLGESQLQRLEASTRRSTRKTHVDDRPVPPLAVVQVALVNQVPGESRSRWTGDRRYVKSLDYQDKATNSDNHGNN